MSKGSNRRKTEVSHLEMTARWALLFGNPDKAERERLEKVLSDIEKEKRTDHEVV